MVEKHVPAAGRAQRPEGEECMGTERLVVVGGDAAGMTAASQARRGRADLEIVALEKGPYVSYAACGIRYYVGAGR